MKKYFIMAVAVLATLTACQPDEPQTVVQTREISFAPAATKTRATTAEEITVANLKKFAVSGFVTANGGVWSADNKIFDNTAVQTSAEPATTTSSIFKVVDDNEVKYWAESSDYKFSAVYPVPTPDWSYSYNYDGSNFTQSISNFSISADNTTPDLLVAKEATASLAAAQTTNYAVGLNFYHMLSRVKFSFQNGFPDDNISIEVSNLKLLDVTETASATITLNNGDGKLNASWNAASDKIDVLFYGDETEKLVVLEEGETKALPSVYRLIIPETKAYSVAFDLVIKSEGNVIATIPYQEDDGDDNHNPIPLKETTFVNGQSYVFNAVIQETIFNEDDLHPITFTVDVEPWGEDTTVDNDIFDPNN